MVLRQALSDIDLLTERLRAQNQNPDKQLPEYFSGARCKILVNGQTIGAALDVSWSVRADLKEVRTIDNFMPVEIVPGQMAVSANLRRVIDPRRTLGGDGLYSTITSYLHQPYASIEVRDRMNGLIFVARGMFKDVQGSVSNGSLGIESISFIGYYWREAVNQEFDPVNREEVTNRFSKNSRVSPVERV